MMIKALGFVAAVSIAGITYCIYFDRKRRSDPNYKRNVVDRRRARAASAKSGQGSRVPPDLRDPLAVQRYFLQEVQLGEELLSREDLEGGVEHFCNAVLVCGQPQELLGVLQQTMQPHIFSLLMANLTRMQQRMSPAAAAMQDCEVE